MPYLQPFSKTSHCWGNQPPCARADGPLSRLPGFRSGKGRKGKKGKGRGKGVSPAQKRLGPFCCGLLRFIYIHNFIMYIYYIYIISFTFANPSGAVYSLHEATVHSIFRGPQVLLVTTAERTTCL